MGKHRWHVLDLKTWCAVQWSPGGKGAHTILERFVSNGLRTFNAHRAKTDRQSTSSLSPHVHFGEISTRHIFYVVRLLPDKPA